VQRIRVGPEIKALDQMEDCQRALEVVFQPGQEAARLPVPEEDCQRALGVVFQLGQEAAYRPDQGEVYPQVQAGDCRQVLEVDYPLVPAEAFRLAPWRNVTGPIPYYNNIPPGLSLYKNWRNVECTSTQN
jgi:hypothetical protein